MGWTTSREIVLGAATLAQLHKQIGDTVDVQYVPGYPRRPIRLTIAGVATMPAIGIAEGLHTSMGVGALVPADAGPVTESLGPQGYDALLQRAQHGPARGSAAAWAPRRTSQPRSGSPVAANQVLARQQPDSVCGGNVATMLSVQHPAQIVNYRSMGTTPVAARRRARRSPPSSPWVGARGLGATVPPRPRACSGCWGSRSASWVRPLPGTRSFAAAIGVVVGIPLGVVLGRWLWILFAEEIGAVPAPTVPVWSLLLAALAAFVLANAAAVAPRSTCRPHRRGARPPRRVAVRPRSSEELRRSSSGWAPVPAQCRRSAS